jgi:hypothetical protein
MPAKKRWDPGKDRTARLNKIFDRHKEGGENCCFCQNGRKAVFELRHVEAIGLPGRWLCVDCHLKVLEIESAIRKLNRGAHLVDHKLLTEGVRLIEKHRKYLSLPNAQRAIDSVRQYTGGNKAKLIRQKVMLSEILVQVHGDRPEVSYVRDEKLPDLVKIQVGQKKIGWCCHIPLAFMAKKYPNQFSLEEN